MCFRFLLPLLPLFLTGCAETTLNDSGTLLARNVVRGSKELSRSNATKLEVRYEPIHGVNQEYEVNIYHNDSANGPYTNQMAVRCETGGYTSWHTRYVFVPRDLHISKSNAPTFVTLRKNGDRIDVVGLR